MSAGKVIRVLVVEDSAVARELLLRILRSDPAIAIAGTAADGEEAMTVFAATQPDVVTMDIHMPRLNGFEATRRIMEQHPVPVVIVTASANPNDVAKGFQVLEAGAVAILEKPPSHLHPDHARLAANLIQTVKLMSEVKVVKRWRHARGAITVKPATMPASRGPGQAIELVAIGASTGGPQVLHTILSSLPQDFDVPILIVQHIAAGFVQGLAEWLDKTTPLRVRIAADGERALPGCAYIAPDGTHLRVETGGRMALAGGEPESGLRPAVSVLFRSVAQIYGPRAAGVLLTGMGRDGAEELKVMRDAGAVTMAQNEETSIIHGMPGAAVKLGAANHILSPEQIATTLLAIVRPEKAAAVNLSKMETATDAKIEILMVEDSLTQAMRLEKILSKAGYAPWVARNGRAALEALEKRQPTMVLTDIQMPIMDGYELCHAIKSNPDLTGIPVMLLTSLSAPQDIIRGLECGADNFVVKPYEEEFLLSRIGTLLANHEFRKCAGLDKEIPVYFAGQKYLITSDRRQILNLLLSTYETAVKTNQDLVKTHDELKAAQAQLIEAEKLQSVGRLAAGVAHEVRNPLAIIEMGVSYLEEKAEAGSDDQLIMEQMREAVRRANFVITELVDLASPRELGMREMKLNDVIEKALAVFADELALQAIEILRDFEPDLCACRVDAAKIEQAFLNILANARDAMPSGGSLHVRTYEKVMTKSEIQHDAGDRSGARLRENDRAVVTEIADTGSGISAENFTKLFEPFFSTKPTGKGMGLGLTVARKVIELHGGRIEIRNDREHGAIVTVTLKCVA